MMRMNKVLVGGVMAMVLGAGLAARGQAADPAPTKLAVVNIVKVFSVLNEKLNSDAEIEAMRKDINEQGRKMQEDLDTESKQFTENPPFREGTPEYKAMQDEILEKAAKLEVFRAVSEQKLGMEQRNRTVMIYNDMNTAITEYAKSTGIGLVFVTDDADFQTAKTTQDVLSRITVRKILYAAPPYDITSAIIDSMNTKFRLPSGPKNP